MAIEKLRMKTLSCAILLSTILLLESSYFVGSNSDPSEADSTLEHSTRKKAESQERAKKQLEELRRRHDVDRDGRLSSNELASAMEETLAILHTRKKARENASSSRSYMYNWSTKHVAIGALVGLVTVVAVAVYYQTRGRNGQRSTGMDVQDIRARRLAKLTTGRKLEQFQQSVSQSVNSEPIVSHVTGSDHMQSTLGQDVVKVNGMSTTGETDVNTTVNKSRDVKLKKSVDSLRRSPPFNKNHTNQPESILQQKDNLILESSLMDSKSGSKKGTTISTVEEEQELVTSDSLLNDTVTEAKEKDCLDDTVSDVLPDLLATTPGRGGNTGTPCKGRNCNCHSKESRNNKVELSIAVEDDMRSSSKHFDAEDNNKDSAGKSIDGGGRKISDKTKPKLKVLPFLPFDEVVKISLENVLDCAMDIEQPHSKSENSRLKLQLQAINNDKTKASLQLQPSDLPTGEDDLEKKLERLVAKRLLREVDPMKFAILCFEKCGPTAPDAVAQSKNGPVIWQVLTATVKELCVDVILKHLVQVTTSPTTADEDLWSDFVNSGESQAPCLYFLSCLGGWSRDGISISTDLLTVLLEKGKHDDQVRETFLEMVVIGGRQVDNVQRLNEVMVECSNTFRGLETLLAQPIMVDWIVATLDKEARQSLNELGVFVQEKLIFSSYLKITTLEARVTQKSRASECFTQLAHFPRARQSDIDHVQSQIQDGLHSCQNIVYRTLLRIMKTESKESVVAWLAAIVATNDMRLSSTMSAESFERVTSSDGFMLNFCTVALQLCEPFFKNKSKDKKYMRIETDYCVSDACRFQLCNESTLSGGHIGTETEEIVQLIEKVLPPPDKKGKFRLVTEMFHLTTRALHIGLMTVIQHYNQLLRKYAAVNEMKVGTEQETEARKLLMLFAYQWETCLQDDNFLTICSQFYCTLAAWLLGQLKYKTGDVKEMESDESTLQRERDIYSTIPEYYLKDMCSWFTFVAVNKPYILKGVEYCQGLMCCMTLLQRKDLVKGPVAATRIVQMMLTFAESTKNIKGPRRNSLDSSNWGSGIEGEMSACVYMCPVVQKALGRALMQTYICVDVVEGLDVDKEEFDKFSSRLQVVKMLNFLWRKPETQISILSECGNKIFQEFLGAILDTLLYVLNDALSRLSNVKKLQTSKQSAEAKWNESAEREEKESFLKNEEHVARSFMTMANLTLEFLEMISENEDVARCFSRSPLSQRAASAIIGFLESLCGPKSQDLRVQNMERYAFNPRELLLNIVTILVRISRGRSEHDGEFVKCLSADPDYCQSTVERACRVVGGQGLASDEIVQDLRNLMCQVSCLIAQKEESEMANKLGEQEAIAAAAGNDLVGLYAESLEQLKFDCAELLAHHAFKNLAEQTSCQLRSCKSKALMKETARLKEHLPVHPNASIFVRQDENRMDVVRALITGPVDTPYSLGCFVFDFYFPAMYPNVPPVVKLVTTGNGTVRFNPNLYADGKVCLSLLGTWHGGDATEKWDSKNSSLYQVLLSIQGMIFISDPVFNEPGYEGIRGTSEGDTLCGEYNASIRLATVRHAMVGQLRHPPAGFEEVVRSHFRLQKDAILKQCSEWLHQCTDAEEERRMRKTVDDLRVELEKLSCCGLKDCCGRTICKSCQDANEVVKGKVLQ